MRAITVNEQQPRLFACRTGARPSLIVNIGAINFDEVIRAGCLYELLKPVRRHLIKGVAIRVSIQGNPGVSISCRARGKAQPTVAASIFSAATASIVRYPSPSGSPMPVTSPGKQQDICRQENPAEISAMPHWPAIWQHLLPSPPVMDTWRGRPHRQHSDPRLLRQRVKLRPLGSPWTVSSPLRRRSSPGPQRWLQGRSQ